MRAENGGRSGRTTNCTYCQSPTDPRSRIIPIRVFGLTRDSRTNLTLVQSVVRPPEYGKRGEGVIGRRIPRLPS